MINSGAKFYVSNHIFVTNHNYNVCMVPRRFLYLTGNHIHVLVCQRHDLCSLHIQEFYSEKTYKLDVVCHFLKVPGATYILYNSHTMSLTVVH